MYDCEARWVRWGTGRCGMGRAHSFESLNGFSEGKGIACGAIARGGGGGGTRRATGKEGRRRELELGSDAGARRQEAVLAKPG